MGAVPLARDRLQHQLRQSSSFFEGFVRIPIVAETAKFVALDSHEKELMNDHGVYIHLIKEGEILGKDAQSHVKFIHGIKALMTSALTGDSIKKTGNPFITAVRARLYST